jgi:hypothetical protein
MILATGLLGWLTGRTDILFADGLRYIHQAQSIDKGRLIDGLLKAVDHPMYPTFIVAAHRASGGSSPESWQAAAQGASMFAGILLVIPLYLVGVELFGHRSAWLGVMLFYLAPINNHVMADTLSESTFLLFWTTGLWCALRFLQRGEFGWLPPAIGFAVCSYLTRPEGLLLPAALIAALGLMPLLRSTRMNWPRWWSAVAFLVIGPAILLGPYIAAKGGLGTKPAIARLLGTAPKSAPNAVERARPLDPDQTALKTYATATKAMFEAVKDEVTLPLLPFVLVGFWGCRPFAERARVWLFLGIILSAAMLALVRLHATGGYCTPRHAMLIGGLLIPAAAAGIDRLVERLAVPGRWFGFGDEVLRPGPAIWGVILLAFAGLNAKPLQAAVNAEMGGYRTASQWLAEHSTKDEHVVDLTGWSQFYAERDGYAFANLHDVVREPNVRYVIARESHLKGPWPYCEQLRELVGDLKPVETYPKIPRHGVAQVYVFDRQAVEAIGQKPVERK